MKRIFFMFLALLLCVMVQAQDNVEITLNNGNVVKGVTKLYLCLMMVMSLLLKIPSIEKRKNTNLQR